MPGEHRRTLRRHVADTDAEPFTLQEYFSKRERRQLRRFLSLLGAAVGLVRRAAPRELLLCAGLQLAIGATIPVQILVIRDLLTELLAGDATFGDLLPEVITMAVVGILVGGAGALLSIRQLLLGQLVAVHTTDGLIRTSVGVDLITYEEPAFHNRLQRAFLSAGSRPAMMVNDLIGIAGASFGIGGVVIALTIIEPIFSLLVFGAFVPVFVATNRASRIAYRYSVEQTERERFRMYLVELLTSKPSAQEVRAFELGGFLTDRQRAIYHELLDELRKVLKQRLRIMLTGQTLTGLLTGGVLAVLVWFVTSDRMSIAEAGSAAGALVLLTGRLRALASNAGGLYEHSLYLEDYSSFVAAAPKLAAARPTRAVARRPEAIVADGLSFTYPSRKQESLVDVSLELRRGEVIALVGENGSGKTTLAKLLAGLYTPKEGIVSWDGIDIAGLDPVSVRSHVSVIFQDFLRYQTSAHENIAYGDHEQFADVERLERAARAAGVHETLAALPRGYETLLGPQYFGGSDLSGGQWQRVALARAFFRDAPIVILDEPTASLDPRAEADLYASMGDLFTDRAVLLISHRFGSVRTADRIYVLRDGRLHESGSHTELMAADGYYAELFGLQSSMYFD